MNICASELTCVGLCSGIDSRIDRIGWTIAIVGILFTTSEVGSTSTSRSTSAALYPPTASDSTVYILIDQNQVLRTPPTMVSSCCAEHTRCIDSAFSYRIAVLGFTHRRRRRRGGEWGANASVNLQGIASNFGPLI